MTEDDKILINAYVDNETTAEESNYIEKLIETNTDAYEYLNLIKKANIEIDSFFEETKNIEVLQKVSVSNKPSLFGTLVSKLLAKSDGNSKRNFLSSLKDFFTQPQLIGSTSLGLLLALSVLFISYQDVDEVSDINFDNNLYIFNISTERSGVMKSFEEILKDVVFEMNEMSIDKSQLVIDENVFYLYINENSDLACISGIILDVSTKMEKNFEFCLD